MPVTFRVRLGASVLALGGMLVGGGAVLLAWTIVERNSILGPILNLIAGAGLSISGVLTVRAAAWPDLGSTLASVFKSLMTAVFLAGAFMGGGLVQILWRVEEQATILDIVWPSLSFLAGIVLTVFGVWGVGCAFRILELSREHVGWEAA